MTGALVDSNIILDVLTEDPVWFEWSSQALAQAAERLPIVINPIIYAEVSIRFQRIEELDDALPPAMFRRDALPWEGGFSRASAFALTVVKEGCDVRRCRTSTSELTRRLQD